MLAAERTCAPKIVEEVLTVWGPVSAVRAPVAPTWYAMIESRATAKTCRPSGLAASPWKPSQETEQRAMLVDAQVVPSMT